MTAMSQEPLAWDANRSQWQRLLNEAEVPPRRAQVTASTPLPVTARLVWERDGVEEVPRWRGRGPPELFWLSYTTAAGRSLAYGFPRVMCVDAR